MTAHPKCTARADTLTVQRIVSPIVRHLCGYNYLWFAKAGSRDAGVLRELHHAARSSDNAERVNQHLPIHGLFKYRLEVVFDIHFGLQVIRRIVGSHLDLSAFALGCHGHSFLAGFLTGGFNSFHIVCAFLMSASWLPLSPPHNSR